MGWDDVRWLYCTCVCVCARETRNCVQRESTQFCTRDIRVACMYSAVQCRFRVNTDAKKQSTVKLLFILSCCKGYALYWCFDCLFTFRAKTDTHTRSACDSLLSCTLYLLGTQEMHMYHGVHRGRVVPRKCLTRLALVGRERTH